jgi:hypothetical protein
MITTVTTLGDATQTAGVVVAALLAAAVLLARAPRARAAAMLGALVLTPVLLVANIWSTPQFEPLRERPLLALAAAGGGLVVLAFGALAIRRRPELLALAAAAALPFRVPIESGGDTANLLVPLYVVIAAAALTYASERLRAAPPADGERVTRADPPTRALEWALAVVLVLYAAQAAYSPDFGRALDTAVLALVPGALLFALVRRLQERLCELYDDRPATSRRGD